MADPIVMITYVPKLLYFQRRQVSRLHLPTSGKLCSTIEQPTAVMVKLMGHTWT